MLNIYGRVTRWLSGPHVERRIALLAFVCALPSLAMGLQSDDFILRRNISDRGPTEAYTFVSRDPHKAHAEILNERTVRGMPWWAEDQGRSSLFRPLSSLSLWLDFATKAPVWWMHFQNCVIYALMVWFAVALYRQLGLSNVGLGLAALFFGLDGGIATSVGWLAARNTLLAPCFGLACIFVHDRSRRTGRPLLLALSCLCFVLSLLSGELGLCTLGYLCAHALTVDRAPALRRTFVLLPYGVVTAAYLAHYVSAGYGVSSGSMNRDVLSAPLDAVLPWLASIPVWLATTATLPIASFELLVPNFHLPLVVFSLIISAILVPLLGMRSFRESPARMFAVGTLLSLVPLAATIPQERLRFFVSFGVYGLLGPWVASEFDVAQRFRRMVARSLWRLHGLWMPLLFVPGLFSITNGPGVAGAVALDQALPRATAPIAILLNAPAWIVPWYQVAKRTSEGEAGPPLYALYAGSQPVEIQRLDDRSLELHVARSWFAAPFEKHIRNVARAPFHPGDHIDLEHLVVDVREVNSEGAPTRARFTFERSLDDPAFSFRYWQGAKIEQWTPPPVGGQLQLAAAGAL